MTVTTVSDPTPSELPEFIEPALSRGALVTIQAECEVEYAGRAEGYLGPGERLIVCKMDGTVLVHRPTGHDPVNWQPPGSTVTVEEEADAVTVTARRSNPNEHITIRLLTVFSVSKFTAEDTAPLELSGTEEDMHAFLKENPAVIEEGLRIIEHERATKYGSIDFFARDVDGIPVLIEVKRRQATHKHVDQLKRYMELYRDSNPSVRGILVAPTASNDVQRDLRENGLEFESLEAAVDAAADVQSTTLADFE